jgi:RNA polymerase sigma factor (sigma-70 family)
LPILPTPSSNRQGTPPLGHSIVDLLKVPPLNGAITDTPSARDESQIDVAGLFREHNAALLRFTAAKLGSEHEAREVAQEAYVRLLQLDRRQTIGFLRSYLFKTAANLASDRLRARRRLPSHVGLGDEDIFEFTLCPERQCAGAEMVAVLDRALAELPQKCRRVLLLYRVEGLTRSEIGRKLGIGERMVRLYLARALEHLQRRLDEASGIAGDHA